MLTLAWWAKKASDQGQSPPQELEVSPCSGPYLLAIFISNENLSLLLYSLTTLLAARPASTPTGPISPTPCTPSSLRATACAASWASAASVSGPARSVSTVSARSPGSLATPLLSSPLSYYSYSYSQVWKVTNYSYLYGSWLSIYLSIYFLRGK